MSFEIAFHLCIFNTIHSSDGDFSELLMAILITNRALQLERNRNSQVESGVSDFRFALKR